MQAPPVVLVKTWLQVLKSDIDKDYKNEVENKIIKVFGNIEIAIIYLEENAGVYEL
ncbi:hypothetical protein AB6T38_11075 [Aliiglaciecola sp. SL4]|uniref:hypothetical protein n=1 Tax=Aliiglaciecola sp. SL4 TaxID=3239806 RepID=UPI00261E4851|nr:hypothetical protein [uncultured Paraglaciecola sp.]